MPVGYPVRSHLEPPGDAQPPHDPPDMTTPGSHLPHSPARHPSVIPHPLGVADRLHPARPPSCRPTATAAPGIPSSSTDRSHPARRPSPRPPTTARSAITATARPSPPVRLPPGFRPTDTHMIRVSSPRPTAPIPARAAGPTRLDHTGPMCTAPAGPAPASPTFDHHAYARPTSSHTRGGTPVTFRRASSDHDPHMEFPCVHPL